MLKQTDNVADTHRFLSDEGNLFNMIACSCAKGGRHQEAAIFLRKAIACHAMATPEDSEYLAGRYSALGSAYVEIGRYEDAIAAFEAAVETLLPLDSAELAYCYIDLAEAHGKLGRYDEVVSLHETALATLGKHVPADSMSFASAYNDFAELYWEHGWTDEAEDYFRRSLAVYSDKLGKTARKTKPVAERFVSFLKQTGSGKAARALRKEHQL